MSSVSESLMAGKKWYTFEHRDGVSAKGGKRIFVAPSEAEAQHFAAAGVVLTLNAKGNAMAIRVIMLEVSIPGDASDAESDAVVREIRQDAEHYALCSLASHGIRGAAAGAVIVDPGDVRRAELMGWEGRIRV